MENPEALIATCIDFRLQDNIDAWIKRNFKPGSYDRVSIVGDVKNFNELLEQVKVAYDLHHINKVVFVNHEDCGGYGKDGTYVRHVHDLKEAKSKIKDLYPSLKVDTYYLHLNGTFEEIG